MKRLALASLIVAGMFASFNAFAVQKDITVVADVDENIEMLQADGSALPQSLRMNHLPGYGLQAATVQTKIFTNNVSKDMKIKLVAEPALTNMLNPSSPAVPLSVTYGGRALTAATPTALTATELFSGQAATGPGYSINQLLEITQTSAGTPEAGSYQGLVSLLLTQDP